MMPAQIIHKLDQNISTQVKLEDNSTLEYYLLAEHDLTSKYYNNLNFILGKNSELKFFDISLHSGESKLDLDINLNNIGASVKYFSVDKLNTQAQSNTELKITHAAPGTSSSQIFRGVYADNSQGNFMGKVIINQTGEHSDAQQNYRAIILDKTARAHVMPQLEVYNNNISASHGASIGELDPDAIFYLRSRGISLPDSKKLLLASFISDVTSNITDIKIKNLVEQTIGAS